MRQNQVEILGGNHHIRSLCQDSAHTVIGLKGSAFDDASLSWKNKTSSSSSSSSEGSSLGRNSWRSKSRSSSSNRSGSSSSSSEGNSYSASSLAKQAS